MQEVTTINGDSGGAITLAFAGPGESPETAPMLVGAESGYACFDGDTRNRGFPDEARFPLLSLANEMRASEDGMWLALVDADQRRYGLVQSNRGMAPGAEGGFYQAHHTREDNVWKDYYYRAAFTLLDEIDRAWAPSDVVVHHLTGHGWPNDLVPVALEATGNLLDRRQVEIQRLVFTNGTCGLKGAHEIEEAVEALKTDEQHGHREFQVDERDPKDLGYAGPVPVRLLKVDVLAK